MKTCQFADYANLPSPNLAKASYAFFEPGRKLEIRCVREQPTPRYCSSRWSVENMHCFKREGRRGRASMGVIPPVFITHCGTVSISTTVLISYWSTDSHLDHKPATEPYCIVYTHLLEPRFLACIHGDLWPIVTLDFRMLVTITNKTNKTNKTTLWLFFICCLPYSIVK